MNNNHIKHSFCITGTVSAILLFLGFIPDKITDKLGVRHIDILSDIRRDSASNGAQSEWRQPVLLPAPLDAAEIPCPPGMVCFDDFSSEGNGLANFFRALDNRSKHTVRIAFFGDSYIEGDIFCGDLRTFLQNEFGGKGAGMIMPTSHVASFRRTVKHAFGGWNSQSLVDQNRDVAKLGVAGNVFIPNKNAWVKYSGVKISNLEFFSQASLIYLSESEASLLYRINETGTPKTVTLKASPGVSRYDIVADSIENIRIDFLSGNINVYGISLQDKTGVVVDNFSLRGAPGTSLKYLPEKILRQTDSLLNYNLIILQYGLNVMTANNTNYAFYQKGMKETIEHLRKCFPKSDIMLLSVGDRSMKKAGNYVTMPAVPALVEAQKAACAETGAVFWNLFEAMGGNASMIDMVGAKPPRANKDYTHLNFEGGKYLGEILFKTFVFEKKKFDMTGQKKKKQTKKNR
ncbi:MAG: GDSL-type esterase/lipase family protein [Prevotellaceae bacterium]|jgi:hypothetical protein|nr:GDSL-type esterase/lipase family protein [Prevotellaceae bacterium]